MAISFVNWRPYLDSAHWLARLGLDTLRYGIFRKKALVAHHTEAITARRVVVGHSVRNRKPGFPVEARRNEIGGSYTAKMPRSTVAHKSVLTSSASSRSFSSSRSSLPLSFSLWFSTESQRRIHLFDGTIDHRRESRTNECERKRDRPPLGIATLDIRGILSIHKPILMIIQRMQIFVCVCIARERRNGRAFNINNYAGTQYAPMIIETKRIWRAITALIYRNKGNREEYASHSYPCYVILRLIKNYDNG